MRNRVILVSFFLFAAAIWFVEVLPSNISFQTLLASPIESDIVIVVHPGGWGNASLDGAKDLAPIVKGIEKTLSDWGYKTVVVPYERTADGIWGKVTSTKKLIQSFSGQADEFAKELELFVQNYPGRKIVMTGLSNGALFVDATMEQLSYEAKGAVLAIELGLPFQNERNQSSRVLRLNNQGTDLLSKGDIQELLGSFFQASFVWFSSLSWAQTVSFADAISVPGHEYSWNRVAPEITTFLDENFE